MPWVKNLKAVFVAGRCNAELNVRRSVSKFLFFSAVGCVRYSIVVFFEGALSHGIEYVPQSSSFPYMYST